MMRRSTFCAIGPFSITGQTEPGLGANRARFTNRDDGSTSIDQTSRKLLSRWRFLSVIVTALTARATASTRGTSAGPSSLPASSPTRRRRTRTRASRARCRRALRDLEEVLAEIRLVDELRAAPRPGAIVDDAIEAKVSPVFGPPAWK